MHPTLVKRLQLLEPGANFSENGPRVTSSTGAVYFAKVGAKRETEQYHGEAEGLKHMDAAAPGICPRVLDSGVDEEGRPYTISEYKDIGPLRPSAAALARRLATELHRAKTDQGFGFVCPTHCGPTRLPNEWHSTWEACFGAMIKTLLGYLQDQGGYDEVCALGEQVVSRVVPALLKDLKIEPALLHGDLWSGNAGTDSRNGEPVIFDPSCFYGHNEMELSISRTFGGFPSTYYEEYHRYYPKAEPVEQYDDRQTLYELFHYLNHTVIFGGGYATGSISRMKALLKKFR